MLGTKIGYAFFAIAWAVFCGSTAGNWGGLALARGAVGAAEAAMIGRPEGQLRMVPGKRTLYCRRLLQRGLLNRRDDRPAAGRLGDCDAQLADGVHYLRCPEFYLGHGVAGLL